MSKDGSSGEKQPNDSENKTTDDSTEKKGSRKKLIRIITVMAYLMAVSSGGATLSGYYLFLWHPPNPREMHAKARAAHSEPVAHHLIGEPEILEAASSFQSNRNFNLTPANVEIVNSGNEILKMTNVQDFLKEDEKRPNATTPSVVSTNSTESSSKKPKLSGKKLHQTPFALKHLQVPINPPARQRSLRNPSLEENIFQEVIPEKLSTIVPNTLPPMPSGSSDVKNLREKINSKIWNIINGPKDHQKHTPMYSPELSTFVPNRHHVDSVQQIFDDYHEGSATSQTDLAD